MNAYRESKNKLIILLAVFVCLSQQTQSSKTRSEELSSQHSKEMLCEKDVIRNGTESFTWKALYSSAELSSQYAASQPSCLQESDGTMRLVLRKCDPADGKWYPMPNDITCLPNELNPLQSELNNYCPEGFFQIEAAGDYLCVLISEEPQEFDETFCYGSDALFEQLSYAQAESILRYLSLQRIDRFWLPLRRDDHNKYLNPFVIKLPGPHWRDIYEIPLPFQDILSDKHCVSGTFDLISQNSSNNMHNTNNSTAGTKNSRKENNSNLWNFQMKITDCDEVLYSVCVFRDNLMAYTGCPPGMLALSVKPDECYGVRTQAGLFPQFSQTLDFNDFVNSHNTFQLVFKFLDFPKDLYFKIDKFNEHLHRYIVEMNVKGDVRVVRFSGNHNGLSKVNLIALRTVEMFLQPDPEGEDLILTVYNRNYLFRFDDNDDYGIRCFSNAGYDIIKTVKLKMFWQNADETKTLFQVKLIGDEPGHYWCEGHAIFNFTLVSTKKIVAGNQNQGQTFATILQIPLCHTDGEWQNLGNLRRGLKHISKGIKDALNDVKKSNEEFRREFHDFDLEKVRIMDVININKVNSRVINFQGDFSFEALCHLTVSLKNNVESSEEASDYDAPLEIINHRNTTSYLKAALEKLLQLWQQGSNSKWHPLRHIEFCLAEAVSTQPSKSSNQTTNQWPKTRHGKIATTTQLCLQTDGLPVTRKCNGDFLWGAFWEDVNSNKALQQLSCVTDLKEEIITEDLQRMVMKKIIKKEPEKAIRQLKSLLEENLERLIPADLYYVARIMKGSTKSLLKASANNTEAMLASDSTKDIVKIYNYLMKVNENVVRPSAKLNSTNVLLETLESTIERMAVNRQSGSLSEPNSSTIGFNPITTNNKAIEFNERVQSRKARSPHRQELKDSDKHIEDAEYEDIGVFAKMLTNFLTFTIDPCVANVTGIALFETDDATATSSSSLGTLRGSFKKHFFRFLLADQSIDDLLYEKQLKLAAYIPQTLLGRLDEISGLKSNTTSKALQSDIRIVINIYANDVLFQEQTAESYKNKSTSGYIISISIPGHGKNLPESLPIVFKAEKPHGDNDFQDVNGGCGYWNYETWASDGVEYLGSSEVDRNIILCGCTHLTPFAYLLNGRYNFSVDSPDPLIIQIKKNHTKALDIITLIGCSLSLIGICGIFVTALTFQNWREKASSKVLLHLSAAIALQMILFCFFNTDEYTSHLLENKIFSQCIAMGALLHYSILVQFSWMIIIAYLQFKRYVEVFANSRPRRFILKASFLGWGLPCIPVASVLLLDAKSYIPSKHGEEDPTICYPSGYSLYFGVVIPITIAITANLFVFVIIIYNILKGSQAAALRRTERSLAISQLRLSVLLFFLLGFTWIFGLMTVIRAGLIFSYLFCLTATLQGFILFIYFVILDPVTRRMWGGLFMNLCGLNENFDSSYSMK